MYKVNAISSLPVSVIRDATHGDSEAMDMILRRYERYLQKLSFRKYTNANGEVCYILDEYLFRRLELKLIKAILCFHVE